MKDDDLIKAYAIIKLDSSELGVLALASPFQRQGYGKELFSIVINFCKTKNICPLTWTCAESNTSAMNFYKSYLDQQKIDYEVEETKPYLDGSRRLLFKAKI